MSAKSTKTPPTPATKTITITIVSLSDSLTVIIELVIAWVRIIKIDNKEKVTRIRIYKKGEKKSGWRIKIMQTGRKRWKYKSWSHAELRWIGNNELNLCENSVMSIKNGIKFEVIQ